MCWDNFVNFSYKQKQDVFHQYKYCYRITKVSAKWLVQQNKPTIVQNIHIAYLLKIVHTSEAIQTIRERY